MLQSFGDGQWPGGVAYHLVAEEMVPIISPKEARRGKIKTIDELLRYPLLQVVTRPTAWRDWFAMHGYSGDALKLGPQFEVTSHVIQAVSVGMGIGLVPSVLVEDELQAATLVVPVKGGRDLSGKAYYLVVSGNREAYPPFALFRDWLMGLAK